MDEDANAATALAHAATAFAGAATATARNSPDLEARRVLAERIVVALREIGLACELIAAEADRASRSETDERRALIRDLARQCRRTPEA
jgi:hypothetical protein